MQLASRVADRVAFLERKCGLDVTVVFSGDYLPCRVEHERQERKIEEKNVQRAVEGLQKLLLGGSSETEARRRAVDQGFLSVVKHRFMPDLIHGVIAWARLMCTKTAFEVAPYDAEAQLAWLFFAKKIDFVFSAENGLAVYQVPTFFLNVKTGFSFTDTGAVGVLLDSWWEGLRVFNEEHSLKEARLHTWQDVLCCALIAGSCGKILKKMTIEESIAMILEILDDIRREEGN